MKTLTFFAHLSLLLVLGGALGCGDSTPSGDSDAAVSDCSAADQLCATLSVPSDFAATPRNVYVGLYASLPPAGPPDVMVGSFPATSIAAGAPLRLTVDGVDEVGDYHVFVALFVEGGGNFQPEPGIDYQIITAPHTFGAGPVELGTLSLELAE